MFRILKKYNLYLKSILNLASGTSLSQIITVSSILILSRIYSPEDFGEFALFSAITAITSVFASARLENLIISLKNENIALLVKDSIVNLALLFSFIVFFILVTIYFFLWGLISSSFLILLPFYIFVSTAYQANYFWLNRNGHENIMSKGLILGALSQATLAIFFGFYTNINSGMILALVFGQFINFVYILYASESNLKIGGKDSMKNLTSVIYNNRSYPINLIPSGLLERFSSQAYIILISSFFGVGNAGQINLYQRTVSFPIRIIGKAIGDVFRRYAAKNLNENGEAKKLFIITLCATFFLALPVFIPLKFYGVQIFEFTFGPQWTLAGEYAQLLSWIFLLSFAVSPISNLVLIGGFPRYDLYLQIYLSTGIALALYWGWLNDSIVNFIELYVTIYCIKYIIEAIVCWNIASGSLINIKK